MKVKPTTIRLDLKGKKSNLSDVKALLKYAGIKMSSGLLGDKSNSRYDCLLFEVSHYTANKGISHLHLCNVRRSNYAEYECNQNTTIPEQFVDMIVTYLFKHGCNPNGKIMKNPCAETPLPKHECLSHKQQLGILEKRLKKGDKIVIADDAEAMWLPMALIENHINEFDLKRGGSFISNNGIESLEKHNADFVISRIHSSGIHSIGQKIYFPREYGGTAAGVYSRTIDIEATYKINGWEIETPMKTNVSEEQINNEPLTNQIHNGESIKAHRKIATITVGERPQGVGALGKSITSAITVQHLSNKTIVGY